VNICPKALDTLVPGRNTDIMQRGGILPEKRLDLTGKVLRVGELVFVELRTDLLFAKMLYMNRQEDNRGNQSSETDSGRLHLISFPARADRDEPALKPRAREIVY
jgi:hypothetical protein